jgi:uncharacterized membrane protein YbhN (UPF0104 family)
MVFGSHVSARSLAACAAALAVVLAVATAPQLLGSHVAEALEGVGHASAGWLWWAGAAFLASLVCAACAWRAAIGLCGARLSPVDACARYGVGSLVNSFTPARLGDVVRIALFSRALPGTDRLWTTGGAFAAIGAARALSLCLLLVAASAVGALPIWPIALAGGAVAAAAAAAFLTRRKQLTGRVAHALDAFRELGRRPAASLPLVGWILTATAARVGGATASAAALGVEKPLHAALLIVPALDLAGLFPITPGNVGLTSGAVAIALQGVGVDLTTAIAVGIALHAVETVAGISFGLAGALWLASAALEGRRGLVLRIAGGVGALGVAAAFSATVLV